MLNYHDCNNLNDQLLHHCSPFVVNCVYSVHPMLRLVCPACMGVLSIVLSMKDNHTMDTLRNTLYQVVSVQGKLRLDCKGDYYAHGRPSAHFQYVTDSVLVYLAAPVAQELISQLTRPGAAAIISLPMLKLWPD